MGNDDDRDEAVLQHPGADRTQELHCGDTVPACAEHDQISRAGGLAECVTGVVEHERPFGSVIDVDRVDARRQRLFLLGHLVGELGAGVSLPEPRRHHHRGDDLDGRIGVGEVERPPQCSSGVVAPVEPDDDALARPGRPPGRHDDHRCAGMRRAVATHGAEPVVAEVTAATLADDQRIGRRGCIDQHVRSLSLDNLRCHGGLRRDVGDRHVEVVTRRGSQAEFVDAEATLRRHHRHHGGNVEGGQRGHLGATGRCMLDGPTKGIDRRAVDANDPMIGHASSIAAAVIRDTSAERRMAR